ncbi:MAG: DNA-3-methyladenine glycosylase 2 family protein [Deltaproteobacteria bacterium]|nr:DNA-3-methyladenine glycosylase 2 family protein [Deltaproteobacteria bacterium]
MANLSLQLKPVAPFRLDLTVWVLRRRAHNLMDRWDGATYRRVLLVRDRPTEVAVRQSGSAEAPELQIEARGAVGKEAAEILSATLKRILGLEIDLQDFYHFASRDQQLQSLVQDFRGIKPTRFPSLFEALTNAIACQQISLTVGIHVLNRLTQAYGLPFPGDAEPPVHAFPRPQDLAGLEPQGLRDRGFSYSKARTLIGLSQGLLDGSISLDNLASLDDEEAVKILSRIKGIGRWSAEYALLRGLGRIHLFPGDDVGARKRLEAWLNLKEALDYQGVQRIMADFAPFGGLIYFHFLLKGLATEGYLTGSEQQAK